MGVGEASLIWQTLRLSLSLGGLTLSDVQRRSYKGRVTYNSSDEESFQRTDFSPSFFPRKLMRRVVAVKYRRNKSLLEFLSSFFLTD